MRPPGGTSAMRIGLPCSRKEGKAVTGAFRPSRSSAYTSLSPTRLLAAPENSLSSFPPLPSAGRSACSTLLPSLPSSVWLLIILTSSLLFLFSSASLVSFSWLFSPPVFSLSVLTCVLSVSLAACELPGAGTWICPRPCPQGLVPRTSMIHSCMPT